MKTPDSLLLQISCNIKYFNRKSFTWTKMVAYFRELNDTCEDCLRIALTIYQMNTYATAMLITAKSTYLKGPGLNVSPETGFC
jgi:hypothetical protein